MLRTIIYIMLFSFSSLAAMPSANLSVLSELSQNAAKEITESLAKQKLDTVYLDLPGNPTDFLLEKQILDMSKGIVFKKFDASINRTNSAQLTIRTTDFSISYINPSKDSITRLAKLGMAVILTNQDGTKRTIEIADESIEETMDWASAEALNNSAPAFARAELPKRPVSMYKRIIEPAIITVVAVLTVVLFFSIRSK